MNCIMISNAANNGVHTVASNLLGAGGTFVIIRGGTSVDSTKRYVLVVEDNRMISMILDETLKMMGFVAVVAENGKIAVEKFNEFMHKG